MVRVADQHEHVKCDENLLKRGKMEDYYVPELHKPAVEGREAVWVDLTVVVEHEHDAVDERIHVEETQTDVLEADMSLFELPRRVNVGCAEVEQDANRNHRNGKEELDCTSQSVIIVILRRQKVQHFGYF